MSDECRFEQTDDSVTTDIHHQIAGDLITVPHQQNAEAGPLELLNKREIDKTTDCQNDS